MTVSEQLQDVIGDLSAAIAGRKPYARTEQERLRRTLRAIADEAGEGERSSNVQHHALAELVRGVEIGVADLGGLARRAGALVQAGGGQ